MNRISKLMAGAAAIAVMSGGAAFAGGFSLKETSTAAQGASFAGASAGGDDITYSSFNPAALRVVEGTAVGVSNSYLILDFELEAAGDSFQGGVDSPLGAAFIGHRLNEDLVVGFRITAPFGLATEYDADWAGNNDGIETALRTFAFTPMVSYDINDELTIGAGVSAVYADLLFTNSSDVVVADGLLYELEGSGWTYGFNVGLLYDITPSATIGIAYHSEYSLKGTGDVTFSGSGADIAGISGVYDATAEADLPAVLSIGARIDVTDSTTLLGEVRYEMWEVLDVFRVTSQDPVTGGVPQDDVFGYQDSFYFALGVEHDFSETLTLRSGVGYDMTPTTDEFRSPRVPDNGRVWISGGGSYIMWDGFKVDAAYTYIFMPEEGSLVLDESGDIDATATGTAHIFSLGGSYEF